MTENDGSSSAFGAARHSRRAFLAGTAGLGALAWTGVDLAGTPASAAVEEAAQRPAAAQQGPYQLENGFFSLSGAYGKFTEVMVDPTGAGRYQPATFEGLYLGAVDNFNAADNGDVTWTAQGGNLDLQGIHIAVQSGSSAAPVGTATWSLRLAGSRLESSYTITWAGTGNDPGLTLVTPWQEAGYSIAQSDGVLFSRFISDGGQYMPAQQLKRQSSWNTSWTVSKWVYATGTGPYDLRLSSRNFAITGSMSASTMTLGITPATAASASRVDRVATIDVLPHTDAVPPSFPVFVASDTERASQLSEFYYERAFSFPFGGTAVDWKDWLGRSLDWTGTAGATGERTSILGYEQDTDGYVWTWGNAAGWPFPNPALYDSRHFTSNAMYILGAWRYYSWTGDDGFLATVLPRVRQAMNFYLEELGGSSGLVTITSPDHTGLDQSVSSNYWDITAFGHRDAYLNAYFYGALEAMAELEAHSGNQGRAEQLRTLRQVTKALYNQVFWDDGAGRYVQCIDVDGTAHDYGSSYVNLEAASWGLPSAEQAERIFTWMETGATEVRDSVLFISGGSIATPIASGETQGLVFTTTSSFTTVATWLPTFGTRGPSFTLTLYHDGPDGPVITSERFTGWGDGGTAHLDFAAQPAGRYYLELSDATGQLAWWSSTDTTGGAQAYTNGTPATDVAARNLAVLGPYTEGPADIYSKWKWAPRVTSRRNDFWYYFGWEGVTVPWSEQLQDGGADLYISGFDVLARARYLSADNAWERLTAILDRWSKPDHLCGGTPLYDGEVPQGSAAGAVGTDMPFPESGVTPASFLYAFVGVEAHPDALAITPNLPKTLASAGVRNLHWRSKQLDIVVTHSTVTINGPGIARQEAYRPGGTVWLPAPTA